MNLKKFVIFLVIFAVLFLAFVILFPILTSDDDSVETDTGVTETEEEADNTAEAEAEDSDDSDTGDGTGTDADEEEDEASDDESQEEEDTDLMYADADEDAEETEIEESGTVTRTLGSSSGSTYTVTVDSSVFTMASGDGFDRYYLISSPSDSVFLEVRYLDAVEAETTAPSFLDRFFEYTSAEFSGESYVRNTGLIAQVLSATNGEIVYDAYLFDTDTGVIAVTICYESTEEAEAFYTILDSLVLG